MTELCRALSDGQDPHGINNLGFISDGKMVCNPMNAPLDFDKLPHPDYALFDEKALYRPMMGKIYRTVAIELHRGCPYTCAYCNSATNNTFYLENTKKIFFRKRSIDKFAEEFDHMVKKYDPEFIYFISDTFLLMTKDEFNHFCDVYSRHKIPFWANTRAETVTEERVRKLADINCYRLNVGIEHGNEEFRKNSLRRNVSNEKLINAVKIIGESEISTVVNNIIGFPGETRDLIFDTIELDRVVQKYCDSVSCTIFAPYHGTLLRDEAVKDGYLDKDIVVNNACNFDSLLRMPHLSVDDINGLYRTFSMYVRMPKTEWPRIKIAEIFDEKGEKMYEELWKEYMANYVKARKHKRIDS